MRRRRHQKRKRIREPDDPAGMDVRYMAVGSTLRQFDSVREYAEGEEDEARRRDILNACEAATIILETLEEEGITDPEELRDMVYDYHQLSRQYQALHKQFEVADPPVRLDDQRLCPSCLRNLKADIPAWCPFCGKALRATDRRR